MPQNTDDDDEFNIEVGFNPHCETDELCDEFFLELDPTQDNVFLRRLVSLAPATWVPLETLCRGMAELPAGAKEILEQISDRVMLCHFNWAGAANDSRQPQHVIAIGETTSMYHMIQLVSVPDSEA